jgi:hypothetical protein
MSTSKRNAIIGGVVGGVGGALLLGALAIVAFKIWGKKRNQGVEDDDLIYNGFNGGSAQGDKDVSTAGTGSGRSPFQSTLESHHGPALGTNVSSNF